MKDIHSNLDLKEDAATKALDFVQDHMKIGLGTGSTTAIFIKRLGEKIKKENINLLCCTTSYQSFLLAKEYNIRVLPIQFFSELDISVDGADEVDPQLNLIKGGGAAHTLEKIVHSMSKNFICIVDPSKKVKQLGEKFFVPIEVIPEAVEVVKKQLYQLNAKEVQIRMAQKKDGPVITDKGNLVIDAKFENFDPMELEKKLNLIPGVVENGIFSIYKPHILIVGGEEIQYRS
ncbi:MAG: ribose 5-phosphate isomerase A [Leptonema sp. (in: bacteria)]